MLTPIAYTLPPQSNGNTGIGDLPNLPFIPIPFVPPWLQRDLGMEATQPTTHPTWRVDFSK